jgi:nitrous oxidase accessory protein NosD
MINSELIIDSVVVTNLTRKEDSPATLLTTVADSIVSLNNLEISDVEFLLFIWTDSFLTITNTSLVNIRAGYYLIEAFTTQDIVIQNLTVTNSSSEFRNDIIHFTECVVESFTDSYFFDVQPFALAFTNTEVKDFSNNTLDGMNRGVRFNKQSTAIISNTTFKNMQQNIREGDIYFSQIYYSGSAIGKFIL